MSQNTNYFELARNDWAKLEFGDKRLNNRAITIASKFLKNPFSSPPKMMKNFKDIKAFYRFMDSDKVTHEKLTSNHTKKIKRKAF